LQCKPFFQKKSKKIRGGIMDKLENNGIEIDTTVKKNYSVALKMPEL